jgi:hypothetical protein
LVFRGPRWHRNTGPWRLEISGLPSHDPPMTHEGSVSSESKIRFHATRASAPVQPGLQPSRGRKMATHEILRPSAASIMAVLKC